MLMTKDSEKDGSRVKMRFFPFVIKRKLKDEFNLYFGDIQTIKNLTNN